MIRLVPNNNYDSLDINSEEWNMIWEYVQYLNKKLIIPVLNEKDFIEVGLYQDYSFSSKKTREICDLLESSINDGTLSQYKKEYDSKLDLNNYTLFPIDKVIDFIDFCDCSRGFYVKTHIL